MNVFEFLGSSITLGYAFGYTGCGINMETNTNECYDIIKFIFCMFTWMYYLKTLKSEKYNFIQNGPHYIRLLPPISCKLLLMWHVAVLVEFHSMLDIVSALSHQQCDESFFEDRPH